MSETIYKVQCQHCSRMTHIPKDSVILDDLRAAPGPDRPKASGGGPEVTPHEASIGRALVFTALRACEWAYRDSDGEKRDPRCVKARAEFDRVLTAYVESVLRSPTENTAHPAAPEHREDK